MLIEKYSGVITIKIAEKNNIQREYLSELVGFGT